MSITLTLTEDEAIVLASYVFMLDMTMGGATFPVSMQEIIAARGLERGLNKLGTLRLYERMFPLALGRPFTAEEASIMDTLRVQALMEVSPHAQC